MASNQRAAATGEEAGGGGGLLDRKWDGPPSQRPLREAELGPAQPGASFARVWISGAAPARWPGARGGSGGVPAPRLGKGAGVDGVGKDVGQWRESGPRPTHTPVPLPGGGSEQFGTTRGSGRWRHNRHFAATKSRGLDGVCRGVPCPGHLPSFHAPWRTRARTWEPRVYRAHLQGMVNTDNQCRPQGTTTLGVGWVCRTRSSANTFCGGRGGCGGGGGEATHCQPPDSSRGP